MNRIKEFFIKKENQLLLGIYILGILGAIAFSWNNPELERNNFGTNVSDIITYTIMVPSFHVAFSFLFLSPFIIMLIGLYIYHALKESFFPKIPSISNFLIKRLIEKKKQDSGVELIFDSNKRYFISIDEYLLWFGLKIYASVVITYSLLQINSVLNQIELIGGIIVLILLFLFVFINYIEYQLFLYSCGLFIEKISNWEKKRIGGQNYITFSEFIKQSSIWTGFAVIITIISGNFIERLIEYSHSVGLIMILVSVILFEAYLIYWKYKRNYTKKIDEFTEIIEKVILNGTAELS